MSDELFNVMTPFADVAELGQGYMNRADGERLWVPLPIQAIEGEQVQFVIHLLDGVPAFAGAGRCIQVADQGPDVGPSVRFEALLDSLVFDERSQPVYDYIVAVRTATLGEEESYERDGDEAPASDDDTILDDQGHVEALTRGQSEVAVLVDEGLQDATASEQALGGPHGADAAAAVIAEVEDGEYVDVSSDASSVAPELYATAVHAQALEAPIETTPLADEISYGAGDGLHTDYSSELGGGATPDAPLEPSVFSSSAHEKLTVNYYEQQPPDYLAEPHHGTADAQALHAMATPTSDANFPDPAEQAPAGQPERDQLHIPMDLASHGVSGRAAEEAQETVINPSIMPIATGILTRPAIALIFRPVRALGPARSASTGQFSYPLGALPTPSQLPRAAELTDGNAALAIDQGEPQFEAAAEPEMAVEFDEDAEPAVVGPEGFMRREGWD